jgi:anthranilate phosphoribosyltransferase
METVAEALKLLGTRYAMVVHSNGLDEISTGGITEIVELKNGEISRKELNPEDVGIARTSVGEMRVSDAAASAQILREIVSGKETGPRKDIVVLNAAAAIIAGGLADDFESAIDLAEASISGGGALECLEKLVEVSNRV